jgi:PAS domain S-box-containing protein
MDPKPASPQRALALMAILALLYGLTGQVGFQINQMSSGYASLVWPPSGIALGMLLAHGARIWPGILVGSFLLNCAISGTFAATGHDLTIKAGGALLIALAATLQALAGRQLVMTRGRDHIHIQNPAQLIWLLILCAPVASLVSATLSNLSLLTLGLLPLSKLSSSWLTWWIGDTVGVLIFMPLIVLLPSREKHIHWKNRPLGSVSSLGLLLTVGLISTTVFMWKSTQDSATQAAQQHFEALATESETALLSRLETYQRALRGGVGVFISSDHVTATDWRHYVEALDIQRHYPGISGIGFIADVQPDLVPKWEAAVRREIPGFQIHPATQDKPFHVVQYIEPIETNWAPLGLNLAFEKHRLHALQSAKQLGSASITHPITLLQNAQKAPGFLLIEPINRKQTRTANAQFLGWVSAPFNAHNFMQKLTLAQGSSFEIHIHDGAAQADSLIFDSTTGNPHQAKHQAKYQIQKTVQVFDRQWVIQWDSTPAFEREQASDKPLFILIAGLLISGAFFVFTLTVGVKRPAGDEGQSGQYGVILPLVVFLVSVAGSATLFLALQSRELRHAQTLIEQEASRIELMLGAQTGDHSLTLQGMANRWRAANRTSEKLWRNDASHMTYDVQGLKGVAWLDRQKQFRWVETAHSSTTLRSDHALMRSHLASLDMTGGRKLPLSKLPPKNQTALDVMHIFVPLISDGKPDGYLVFELSVAELFGLAVTPDFLLNYQLTLSLHETPYFKSASKGRLAAKLPSVTKTISIVDQAWEMQLRATEHFAAEQKGLLPNLVLFAGIIIAGLAGLTTRYALVYRLKSESLNQSSQLNRAILPSTPLLIVSTDKNGLIQSVNDAAQEQIGYTADELINKQNPGLWHDPNEVLTRAAVMSAELKQTIEPGFEVFVKKAALEGFDSNEWTFIRKDGSRFPVNLTVSPLRALDGSVTGYVGVIEDITERSQQQQALKASEEIFRLAMEHAPIGMGLIAPNGQWITVNPAMSAMLGHDVDTLLVNSYQSVTHPDDLARESELMHSALCGDIKTYQLEKRVYHANGKLVWVLENMSLVRYANGEPRYFIVHMHDITARQEMDRIKSEFISIVSHELRTPLTSIRGSLGLIAGAMANEISDKVARLINIANSNAERLIHLVNDILDIDKIASGQMRFDYTHVQLAQLIQNTIEANRAFGEKFGVTLVARPMDDTLYSQVDASRLTQVLTNFVSNAAKFSPQGSQIDLELRQVGDHARISVIDHGAGIPEEFRDRIFGKFTQADSTVTRSKGGSGLGLHISKKIIECMHGRIGFDSEINVGSTFWIEMPLTSSKHDSPEINPSSDAGVATGPSASHLPTILHVEDDADLSHVLATALHGKADVVQASRIQTAEQLLAQRRFNLILLDLALPDGSGLNLLDKLPGLNQADVPVLILSASDTDEDVHNKVAAALVKSKASEATVINTILKVMHQD